MSIAVQQTPDSEGNREEKRKQEEAPVRLENPLEANLVDAAATVSAQGIEANKAFTAPDLFKTLMQIAEQGSATVSGKVLAALIDLNLCSVETVRKGNSRLDRIESSIGSHESSTTYQRIAPGFWRRKMENLRQERINEIASAPTYVLRKEDINQSCLPLKELASDPQRAAQLCHFLKKLGAHPSFAREFIVGFKKTELNELKVLCDVYDYLPKRSMRDAPKIFSEACATLEGARNLNLILNHDALRMIADSAYKPTDLWQSVIGGTVVLTFISTVVGGSIVALTMPTYGLYVIGAWLTGCTTILPWSLFKSSCDAEHPYYNIARKLHRREKLGILKDQEIKHEIDLNIPRETEEDTALNSKALKSFTLEDRAEALHDGPMKLALENMLKEREMLRRILTAVGIQDFSPALIRSFVILDGMLERYDSLPVNANKKKFEEDVMKSIDFIRAHLREIDDRIKNEVDTNSGGDVEAIKSLLSPREELGA